MKGSYTSLIILTAICTSMQIQTIQDMQQAIKQELQELREEQFKVLDLKMKARQKADAKLAMVRNKNQRSQMENTLNEVNQLLSHFDDALEQYIFALENVIPAQEALITARQLGQEAYDAAYENN